MPPAPPAPLRFAVLRHLGIPDPHFDLLFELAPGAPLATWRSPAWPITQPTNLTQLPDHRPLYLDYQGPLSNNRGAVQRIAAGTHEPRRLANRLTFHFLTPTHLSTLILEQLDGDHWTARPT